MDQHVVGVPIDSNGFGTRPVWTARHHGPEKISSGGVVMERIEACPTRP